MYVVCDAFHLLAPAGATSEPSFPPLFFGTCKDTAGWLWPVGTSPELGSWYGRPYAPTSSIQICTHSIQTSVFRPSFNSLLLRFVFTYPDDSSINKYRSIFFLSFFFVVVAAKQKHICMVHDNDVSVLYACDACSVQEEAGLRCRPILPSYPSLTASGHVVYVYVMTNIERKLSCIVMRRKA